MKQIIIFGMGSLGQLACRFIQAEKAAKVAAFAVHGDYLESENQQLIGVDVVAFETLTTHFPPDRYAILVAVGYKKANRAREEISRIVEESGYERAGFVSKQAQIGPAASIGDGCVIMPGATLMPDASIGKGNIVWPGAYIGWATQVGDWCYIASNATIGGSASVGNHCFLGVGATVRDGLTVAEDCVIGMGAALQHASKPGSVFKAPPPIVATYRSSDVREF